MHKLDHSSAAHEGTGAPQRSSETMDVMIAAGRLKVEDFYPDPALLDQQLGPALEFIQRDPELGLSLPLSAFVAELDLRRFIVLLYEKASGKTLLPNRARTDDILQILQTTPAQG